MKALQNIFILIKYLRGFMFYLICQFYTLLTHVYYSLSISLFHNPRLFEDY